MKSRLSRIALACSIAGALGGVAAMAQEPGATEGPVAPAAAVDKFLSDKASEQARASAAFRSREKSGQYTFFPTPRWP